MDHRQIKLLDPLDALAELIEQPEPGAPVDEFDDDFLNVLMSGIITAAHHVRMTHKRAGGKPLPPGRI